MSIANVIRQRRSGQQAWVGVDPVLEDGERAYLANNSSKFKIGDGERKFSELPWFESKSPVTDPLLANAEMHLIADENITRRVGNSETNFLAHYRLAKG